MSDDVGYVALRAFDRQVKRSVAWQTNGVPRSIVVALEALQRGCNAEVALQAGLRAGATHTGGVEHRKHAHIVKPRTPRDAHGRALARVQQAERVSEREQSELTRLRSLISTWERNYACATSKKQRHAARGTLHRLKVQLSELVRLASYSATVHDRPAQPARPLAPVASVNLVARSVARYVSRVNLRPVRVRVSRAETWHVSCAVRITNELVWDSSRMAAFTAICDLSPKMTLVPGALVA